MFNPHDYTVGWICALTTEYVAAQVFLDEEHATPEYVSPNDNNNYTLGKIGPHNVVIAVLPHGEYGLSSAASVARDMLHSFPNIRIGLMVGIGGGAPSAQHDVRLGDVVVSTTVFQYDAGKAIQGEEFQFTKILDQPPAVLRTAVNGLAAKYEISGNRIHADVCEVLEKRSRLKRKYGRPNLDEDRLFKSEITHASQCGTTCRADSTPIIERTDRRAREDDPVIHHGVIASANTLMKDAVCRDQLAARNKILCFEMEAAGLMNHFPCLVIRGICDYADTHKNKHWQGYAAMTAAAYAKELLRRISPTGIEVERKISEVLSKFSETVTRTETTVSIIKCKLEGHEDRAMLDWFSTEDYSSEHSDYINRREVGTGQWLMGASEFQELVQNPGQVLFCPGIPGAGKTILASTVIDYLQRKFDAAPEVGVAYIYFNYKRHEMQRLSKVLASILRQLLINRQHIPQVVNELYRQHKARNQRPSSSALTEAIKQVTALYSRVFIVVDALDECQTADGCREQFLSVLFNLQADCNANILATSRALPEIVEQFTTHRRLEIRARDEDIQIYLDGRIARSRLPLLSANRDLIKAEIVNVVDGMFLLAQLHYDTVSTRRTLRQIKDTLRALPTGAQAYDQAYEEAMKRISGLDEVAADIARRVLLWITCAKRPLTTVEMQHALAVVLGERSLDEENMLQTDDMVSACTGLVTVDQERGVIRLVHYTAQEYLQRMQHRWFPTADVTIAEHCITYLLFADFEEGACASDEAFEARLASHPLFDYAACNWGHHARSADEDGLESLALSLLENDQKRSAASQGAMASPGVRGYIRKAPSNVTAFHLAAYFGLSHLVVTLLRKGHSPDARDSHGRTPLSLAAAYGRSAVVALLLATENVDVNSQDNDGRTPVSWAAANGHKKVVEQLLGEINLDLSRKDELNQGASDLAEAHGHDQVAQLVRLPDSHESQSATQRSANMDLLFRAAKKGNVTAVRLHLREVDINSTDYCDRTALSWAAFHGHKELISLLLGEAEADYTMRDHFGKSALDWAVINGHEAAAKTLLEEGYLNVNHEEHGRMAIFHATHEGHRPIVDLLLRHGADPALTDASGRTPLWYAARDGDEDIVHSLLRVDSTGANNPDNDGISPLVRAALSGHLNIVRLLRVGGNSSNCTVHDPSTPLGYAHSVVGLLTNDALASTLPQDSAQNLLAGAINKGHVAVAKYLLTQCASLDIRQGIDGLKTLYAKAVAMLLLEQCNFHSQLHTNRSSSCQSKYVLAASAYGHLEVIQAFLEMGADIDRKPRDLAVTPLAAAASNGHFPVVKFLVLHGAALESKTFEDPYARTSRVKGRTPLSLAAERGDRKATRFLLEQGSNVESEDSIGWTPLVWAAHGNHHETAQLLIEWGADARVVCKTFWETPKGGRWSILQNLLRLRIGPDQIMYEDNTTVELLFLAIADNQPGGFQQLLEKGFHVDARHPRTEVTLLHWAVRHRNCKIIQLLLDRGANIESRVNRTGGQVLAMHYLGQTPLAIAAAAGWCEGAQLLLAEGADIYAVDAGGRSPLQWAVKSRNDEMVKLLLSKSLANAAETGRLSALYPVFREPRFFDRIQALVESKRGTLLEDDSGQRPRDLIDARGDEDIPKGNEKPTGNLATNQDLNKGKKGPNS